MKYQHDDNLRVYVKYPLLTFEQEVDLIKRAQAEDLQALHDLVMANMRLVIKIAWRYESQQVPLMDLVHEGALALIKAAEEFDYTKGFRFGTYATWWVRKAMDDACAQQGVAPMSPYYFELLLTVRRFQRRFQGQGVEPTIEKLAAAVDRSVELVSTLLSAAMPISLDTPIDEEGSRTLADLLEDTTSEEEPLDTAFDELPLIEEENQETLADTLEDTSVSTTSEEFDPLMLEKLEQVLGWLEPREQVIIKGFYGLGGPQKKLTEIASELVLGRSRAQQLKRIALAKLKQFLL